MITTRLPLVMVGMLTVLSCISTALQAQEATQRVGMQDEQPLSSVDTAARYGVGVYGIYGDHLASFRTLPPDSNCCTGFGNAVGYGFGADVFFRDRVEALDMPLTARIGYRQFASPFRATTTERVFDGSIKTADGVIDHALDVTWHQLSLGLSLEAPIIGPLSVSAGVDASYTVEAAYNQSERIVSPSTMTFETGTDTRNVTSGSLTGYNAINLLADLGLRIRLFQLNDTKISQDQQWVDLRGRYLLQLTPTYNMPAEGAEPARSLRSNLLTFGLEFTL